MMHSHNDRRALIAAGVFSAPIIFLICWSVGHALAHTAPKGWEYPWECCHNQDCAEIADSRVHTSSEGYVIDNHFVVPASKVRQSPDGHYHACFLNPEKLECFFAPPTGS